MRIQQLQASHPGYNINQIRDKGRFTRFVVATDQSGQQYHYGTTGDVDLSLRNQELIHMANRGECELTDIDFKNGSLRDSLDTDSNY